MSVRSAMGGRDAGYASRKRKRGGGTHAPDWAGSAAAHVLRRAQEEAARTKATTKDVLERWLTTKLARGVTRGSDRDLATPPLETSSVPSVGFPDVLISLAAHHRTVAHSQQGQTMRW